MTTKEKPSASEAKQSLPDQLKALGYAHVAELGNGVIACTPARIEADSENAYAAQGIKDLARASMRVFPCATQPDLLIIERK